MSEAYVGEIRIFAGNYAPRQWSFCQGQLMSIAENNALFSLLGTTYGGDGRVTFGLPEMRGRLPVHQGLGAGLSSRPLGARFGAEGTTLSTNQIPAHTHTYNASSDIANSPNPGSDVLASQNDGDLPYAATPADPANLQNMNSQTLSMAGGSQAHNNMMPSLSMSFIICLYGIYPSRS